MTFDPLTLRRAYTEYLGKLGPLAPGMKGTDLGISFRRDDRLVFLFGDTMAADDRPELQDVDFAATAPIALERGDDTPSALEWVGPLAPRGLPLPRMGVPVEGLARDDETFVFFATDFDERAQAHATSALTKTRGLALERLEVVHRAPAGGFANISAIVEDEDVFVLGTGNPYRKSAVHLARVPLAHIEDRSAWRIDDATIVDVRTAGEISARKHPTLPLYLLTYATADPRGIALRLARAPEGPWIAAGMLYLASDGYERFIHARESAVGHDDGLSQPGDEETWGGEYGAYLVPEWCTEEDGAFGIVFTLSSWNPYCVHVLRTWLVPEGTTRTKRARGAELPPPRLASDETFSVDVTTRGLRFTLRPSWIRRPVTVVLRRDATGEIVRASRSHRWRPRRVEWNLEAYRGELLRLDVAGADLTDAAFF